MRQGSSGRLSEAWLLCRLAGLYVLFSILKRIVPVTALARWAWRAGGPRGSRNAQRWESAALRITRSLRFGDRDCLQRSLLLYNVLSRAGADPVLVIGFRREDGRVSGHASVITDGRAPFEVLDSTPPFLPTLRFGSGGTLLAPSNGLHDRNG